MYFLSFSPILMKFGTDVLPLGVDVQDTFFDSGRKCVAMVTAYYTVKKYCGAGVLITFSDISSFLLSLCFICFLNALCFLFSLKCILGQLYVIYNFNM